MAQRIDVDRLLSTVDIDFEAMEKDDTDTAIDQLAELLGRYKKRLADHGIAGVLASELIQNFHARILWRDT